MDDGDDDSLPSENKSSSVVKRVWSDEEDQQLLGLVATSGTGGWAAKAAALPGTRMASAIRTRHCQQLRPKDAGPVAAAGGSSILGPEARAVLRLALSYSRRVRQLCFL